MTYVYDSKLAKMFDNIYSRVRFQRLLATNFATLFLLTFIFISHALLPLNYRAIPVNTRTEVMMPGFGMISSRIPLALKLRSTCKIDHIFTRIRFRLRTTAGADRKRAPLSVGGICCIEGETHVTRIEAVLCDFTAG